MTTHTEGEPAVENDLARPRSRAEIIQEIRKSKKTYFVRNNTNRHVSCSSATPPLSLGPAGQGRDIAVLSKSALEVPGFQRLWAAGKITITDDPAVEDEMINSDELSRQRLAKERASLLGQVEVEESSSNRDLVEKKCLISGERVYQTVRDIKNMVPPLAPAYKDRAHEFTPTLSQDERGNEVVNFTRITIDK